MFNADLEFDATNKNCPIVELHGPLIFTALIVPLKNARSILTYFLGKPLYFCHTSPNAQMKFLQIESNAAFRSTKFGISNTMQLWIIVLRPEWLNLINTRTVLFEPAWILSENWKYTPFRHPSSWDLLSADALTPYSCHSNTLLLPRYEVSLFSKWRWSPPLTSPQAFTFLPKLCWKIALAEISEFFH